VAARALTAPVIGRTRMDIASRFGGWPGSSFPPPRRPSGGGAAGAGPTGAWKCVTARMAVRKVEREWAPVPRAAGEGRRYGRFGRG